MNITLSDLSKAAFFSIILSLALAGFALAESPAKQNIKVSVSLDPALSEQLNPEHTLFIYARAAQGPRMPLAIVKHKAGDLPLETQLDASMAMMPDMSLNNFPQVILLARISASGNAMPQAGDLIGQTAPLEWQKLDNTVAITINKQR
ncbi:MAG: hypothetical protein QNL62_10815 [Gammaproteobacteria bacterium]|nr:hypothetical protein [Gammaproteobacteria bacterium]